jgi:hypothetical protein
MLLPLGERLQQAGRRPPKILFQYVLRCWGDERPNAEAVRPKRWLEPDAQDALKVN